MSVVPRLRSGLLRHDLDKQFLVYDPQLERVHLLDPTTAFVFEQLEKGETSLDVITSEAARRNDVEPDPAYVWLAVEELRNAGLLEQGDALIPPLENVTRRELVRNLAMAGAAAFLIPAVATLTATRGYAQSIGPGGQGAPCTGSLSCGPGLVCCNGICSATCGGNPGDNCTSGGECQSGICCGGQCSATPCGTLGDCENCFTDEQCQGGTCSQFGRCGIGNDADKSANGDACNGNGNCCSNHCTNGICTPT